MTAHELWGVVAVKPKSAPVGSVGLGVGMLLLPFEDEFIAREHSRMQMWWLLCTHSHLQSLYGDWFQAAGAPNSPVEAAPCPGILHPFPPMDRWAIGPGRRPAAA